MLARLFNKDLTIQSITPSKILSLGLSLVGFSAERQASARKELNIRRFISFYGAPPTALAPLFIDVKVLRKEDCPTCEDLFMTCNWLKCYDTMHVLEGRWGYCEDYMRPRIMRCQKIMQALRKQKMNFVDSDTKITASLDTVSFMVQEFRNDPSSKWFDHKTKSAGLVSNVYDILDVVSFSAYIKFKQKISYFCSTKSKEIRDLCLYG